MIFTYGKFILWGLAIYRLKYQLDQFAATRNLLVSSVSSIHYLFKNIVCTSKRNITRSLGVDIRSPEVAAVLANKMLIYWSQ